MASASTIKEPRSISKLPPEILAHIFLHLSGRLRPYELAPLCQVCKAWLPIARATLCRSVTLNNFRMRRFARMIEGNGNLAPLIKHITLDYSITRTDWGSIHRILRVLSPHETLLSFRLPAITQIDPESTEFQQSISLLSFLGHLDVDINIFKTLHTIKQFIALFPQLHTLNVNDERGQDVEDDWLEGWSLDAPIAFPSTVRRLGYNLSAHQFLEAFLPWIPDHTETIQSFSVTISAWNSQAPLGSTLRSFGAALTSLSLVYEWRAELPSIDLCENTNLCSLMITVAPLYRAATAMKEHLSTVFKTLSSASLETVEFNLELDKSMSPRYDFVDWGALDKAVGDAYVWVSVLCREKSQIAGVEEGIVAKMPQHCGKLSCSVSAAFTRLYTCSPLV